MEDPLNIQLVDARKMLERPETRGDLIESLGQLSEFSIEHLSPLVFDLISHSSSEPVAADLKRMLQLRPEWVNRTAGNFNTPLMEAVLADQPDLVKVLIEAGADTSYRPRVGYGIGTGVLDLIALNLHPRPGLIENLLAAGTFTRKEKDKALYQGARHGNLALTRRLLADGAGFDVTIDEETALSAAAAINERKRPSVEIVQALLQHEDAKLVLNEGWSNNADLSPLHRAAEAGNTGIMKLLLEAGARVNPPPKLKPRSPMTPLMSAAIGLQPKAMSLLVKAGADATLVDISGLNALHYLATFYAFENGPIAHQNMVKCTDILLAGGTDPSQPNNEGQLPQDIARNYGKHDLVSLLEAGISARGLESTPTPVMPRSPSSRRL